MPRTPLSRRIVAIGACVLLVSLSAACADADDAAAPEDDAVTVRLLTHDSFAISDGVFDEFTDATGIEVELIQGGDAGTVVNQAILTKGNPQADVLFGIDSTFLSRALDEELFLVHELPEDVAIDAALLLDNSGHVSPVDYGDVCVNYDKAYFAEQNLAVPTSLDDLIDPAYRDLLVVENPATSSPGLAFLLATVAQYGGDGWADWWAAADANGVQVVDGWEEAYNGAFSGGGASEGSRPLVVSYASSPPVEVIYADPPITDAPTGVVEATCFRQVEGAGVLAGTDHPDEAGQLVDFLLSDTFQSDVALSMFVFPVRTGVELPQVFVDHAARPASVLSMPDTEIAANRDAWIDEWTDLVQR